MTLDYETCVRLKAAGFDQRDDILERETENIPTWYPESGYHLVMDEPELVEHLGSENCKKRRAFCYSLEYMQSAKGKANTVLCPHFRGACGGVRSQSA